MSARFEIRARDGGIGIWDHRRDQWLDQPGMRHVYWWPTSAQPHAQAYINRQQPAATGPTRAVHASGQRAAPGPQSRRAVPSPRTGSAAPATPAPLAVGRAACPPLR